jgi:glycine dehydrogenase
VIQRNILENPGWYTQYTPYQAEIAQGRLEALLNFQTMVAAISRACRWRRVAARRGTAAAEAMALCFASSAQGRAAQHVLRRRHCHPQTIAVVQTRAEPLGIEVVVVIPAMQCDDGRKTFGVLLQYPTTAARSSTIARSRAGARRRGAGGGGDRSARADAADAAGRVRRGHRVGNGAALRRAAGLRRSARGVHGHEATEFERKRRAASSACRRTRNGNPAYRMAMQTREQHIRREKATSNICTAQVLLAIMAGDVRGVSRADGLKRRIGGACIGADASLAAGAEASSARASASAFFDTMRSGRRRARARRC